VQTLLKLLAVAALAPAAAFSSDADSRSEAAFERKTEKNAILARNLAKRLTLTIDQRNARDTRLVPYKSNLVSAYVRRVEKQKIRDSAKKKREEDLKRKNAANNNAQAEAQSINDDILDMDNGVRKHKHRR
jgi:hypothetical protein